MSVTISGVPTWLSADFTTVNSLTPGTPLTDNFTLSNFGGLARGTYTATIAFTNTFNHDGDTSVTATLRIYNGKDCKDGGWKTFPYSPPGPFTNQGHCVSYFDHIGAPP